MRNKHKVFSHPKSTGLLKQGSVIMFTSIIILAVYLGMVSQKKSVVNDAKNLSVKQSVELSENKENDWEMYRNEEYNIEFEIPKLLYKSVQETDDENSLFIVFAENKFSKEKGVAFGINDNALDDEVNRIKESFESEKGVLVDEKEISIKGFKAIKLEYEPQEDDKTEKRAVVVIERPGRLYSISTVPEQIDRIIGSINFF